MKGLREREFFKLTPCLVLSVRFEVCMSLGDPISKGQVGMLVIPIGVKNVDLIPLMIFSLKMSTVEVFALPVRVLRQKT